MYYNVRKKTFADGTEQYTFSDKVRAKDYEVFESKKKGKGNGNKKADSRKRAVQMVFDIAKSNIWDWFITLTFNPQQVDSFDYDECADSIKRFTRSLRDKADDFVYLLVPEKHESGRYHFHGLIKGDLPHEEAVNSWGKPILDAEGHQVYNIPIFDDGFTTAIKCYSQAATGYVAKYITKQDCVPDGRKRYWASRNCAKPKLEYAVVDGEEYCRVFNVSDYQKLMKTPYGTYELLEIHGKEGQAGDMPK